MRVWKRLPGAIPAILPLLLYAPFLFGGKVVYWGVYLLQFYPWRQLAVEQIHAGHWPLWNPYLGAGTPLAANLQTAAFYPPNALFLLMPVERAFGWELALHVALAGLFAYYLGRTLGLSPFGALVSGLTYGLGGYVVARWVFPSMLYAAAWLPLMLALTERLIRQATTNTRNPISNIRWLLDVALLALAVALQLLAGHAQTSFYSLVIVAVFALVRVWDERQRTKHKEQKTRITHYLWPLTLGILAVAWGIALAAVQLLPTAELAAHSQRAGTLADLRFAYELSFWPWRLISLLAPDFFGNPARNEYWAYGTYWEEAAYVAILSLMLAALALAAWWRTRRQAQQRRPWQKASTIVPFFALLSFCSILLALGEHTPLYPLLFRYVPGFGLFQAPARLMIGYAMGMAVLAGIGADTLHLTPRTRTLLRIALLVGLGAGSAGALTRLILPGVRPSFGSSMIRLGLTLALAAGVLLLRGRRLRERYWQAAVIAFIAADLLAFGWGLVPGTDPAVYHAPVATAEFLQAQPPGRVLVAYPYAQQMYDEYVSLRSFGSADPAYLQGLRESLLPDLNTVPHLPGVGNYDPLTIGLYQDLWDQIEGEGDAPPALEDILPLLNLFGARYVISDAVQGPPLMPVLYDSGPYVYRNDAALPDAFLVPRARVVEDEETRLAILLDPAFDPRAEVLLSHPLSTSIPPSPADESPRTEQSDDGTDVGVASVWREGPDRIVIQVHLNRPGYLVLTDTYYPGWRATVDGEPAEILPANHAFRAIDLTTAGKGDHSVIFEYAPLSFRVGAWITLAAALLLAATLLAGWLCRRAR